MNVLLNCDLGEGEAAAVTDALLASVDLANIACGGHAGDAATMRRVVRSAMARGVQPGAHPGWPARASFGRAAPEELTAPELVRLMEEQLGRWRTVVCAAGGQMGHVKLHGALYHLCEARADLAEACVDGLCAAACCSALVCAAGGRVQACARRRGVPVLQEIFADRGYAAPGQLIPRGQPGALLGDPHGVAARMEVWRKTGCLALADGRLWRVAADTVGMHADAPGCVAIAQALRQVLA